MIKFFPLGIMDKVSTGDINLEDFGMEDSTSDQHRFVFSDRGLTDEKLQDAEDWINKQLAQGKTVYYGVADEMELWTVVNIATK